MTTTTSSSLTPSEQHAIEAATRWHVRAQAGLAGAERAELLAWLRASPENAAALDLVSGAWEASGAAARSEALAPPLLRARRLRLTGAGWRAPRLPRLRSPWGPAFGLAAAAVATAAVALMSLLSVDKTYETPRGEQLTAELADGTRVKLDAATRVDVRFGPFRREVRLVGGEAEFDVGKDRWRPFRLAAGHVQVWDRGTRFAVRERGDGLRVVLIQGRVELHGTGAGALLASLLPGQAATVAANGRIAVAPADIPADLAWSQGEVVFKDVSLGEALNEFSARTPASFAFADPALGGFRVSGMFHVNDPVGFLNAVAALYPVTWRETGPGRFELRPGEEANAVP